MFALGKSIANKNKRPIEFAIFLLVSIAIAYNAFVSIGYYWTVLIPNLFLLYITTVLLLVYIQDKDMYDKVGYASELPPVSVVIPSYNCKDTIGRTIQSIKNSNYPNNIEIVVVDDGSTDGTREYLKTINGIKLVIKQKNEGKAEALNYGLRKCSHEYVFCIDSDSYVDSNSIKNMTSKMVKDKNYGAVTCFVKVANNGSLLGKVQEIEYFVGFGFSAISNYLIDAVFVTPGPMTLFRKSAVLDVGLFDTENITEDLEMAWRLRKNGYKIGYVYEAVVYTIVPETFKDLWRQRIRWYRGKLSNIIKHKDMFLNPKYGYFGMFVMPFSLASELAALATTYFLAYIIGYTLYWNAQAVLSFLAVNSLTISNLLTGVMGSSAGMIMFLVVVVPWITVLFISHKLGNKKIRAKDIPFISFFLFIYSIFLSVVYVCSLYEEIYGRDYTW